MSESQTVVLRRGQTDTAECDSLCQRSAAARGRVAGTNADLFVRTTGLC